MKLTLEMNNGEKLVVETNAVQDLELDIDNLPVEYMFEQLRAQIDDRREKL